MTREEWKANKDFDDISRDMNGLFSEWPTPAEIVAGTTGELKAEGSVGTGAARTKSSRRASPTPPLDQSLQ